MDATGLHPVHEKVQAIKEAPTPSNVTGIFGIVKQVLAKSVHFSYPTAQTDTEGHKVAVGERTKGCI